MIPVSSISVDRSAESLPGQAISLHDHHRGPAGRGRGAGHQQEGRGRVPGRRGDLRWTTVEESRAGSGSATQWSQPGQDTSQEIFRIERGEKYILNLELGHFYFIDMV